MRIAILVAALFLSVGASAWAASSPAPRFPQTWPVIRHVFKLDRPHASPAKVRACMAHSSKVARWLAPVACEQPPRSEPLITALFG